MPALEALRPDAQQLLDVLTDQTIERRLLRPSRAVYASADLHAGFLAHGRASGGNSENSRGVPGCPKIDECVRSLLRHVHFSRTCRSRRHPRGLHSAGSCIDALYCATRGRECRRGRRGRSHSSTAQELVRERVPQAMGRDTGELQDGQSKTRRAERSRCAESANIC
jgi:hypothetical protein